MTPNDLVQWTMAIAISIFLLAAVIGMVISWFTDDEKEEGKEDDKRTN